jgi:hypothetical protein
MCDFSPPNFWGIFTNYHIKKKKRGVLESISERNPKIKWLKKTAKKHKEVF